MKETQIKQRVSSENWFTRKITLQIVIVTYVANIDGETGPYSVQSPKERSLHFLTKRVQKTKNTLKF